MLKKSLVTATLLLIVLALAILLTYNARGILFHSLPWLIGGVTLLGIAAGISRGLRYDASKQKLSPPLDRHTLDSFLEHWGTVVGILLLFISGIFIQASYRRGFSENLHFLGLIMTLFFGAYFLAHFFVAQKYRYLWPNVADIVDGTVKKYLLRARWQDTGKYLSSQKSSFLAFVILGIGILITGTIKLAAFYFGVPGDLNHIATQAHDILARIFVLLLLIHILLAVIGSSHRRLLRSFFTGKEK